MENFETKSKIFYENFSNSELFIGLTGPLGSDLNLVSEELSKILCLFGYESHSFAPSEEKLDKKPFHRVKISQHIINEPETEKDNFEYSKKVFPKRFEMKKSEYNKKNQEEQIHFNIYKDGKETKYTCSQRLMDWGDNARKITKNNAILAYMAIEKIAEKRESEIKSINNPSKISAQSDNSFNSSKKMAYIIQGLKRPEEVDELRRVYDSGFFLIGVYSDRKNRHQYLQESGMSCDEACKQLERDEKDKNETYGQNSSETFELSDFFINQDWSRAALHSSLKRFIHLIFGDPYITPTFDEYAMFIAYSSAMVAMDLARSVGAVVTTQQNDIIATGYADVPKFGGGNYITEHYEGQYYEISRGRDIQLGRNSGKKGISELCEKICQILINEYEKKQKVHSNSNKPIEDDSQQTENTSRIGEDKQKEAINPFKDWLDAKFLEENTPLKDLIEFMRSSHAEVEAILSCARNGISTKGCTLYSTTMPCHECGKRIIGAGIERVVFIEPYAKSRTLSNHPESTHLGFEKVENKVNFEPFVGIGPRRFVDLFSMKIGSGYPIRRQDKKGYPIHFESHNAYLRMPLYPLTYLDREKAICNYLSKILQSENISNEVVTNKNKLYELFTPNYID